MIMNMEKKLLEKADSELILHRAICYSSFIIAGLGFLHYFKNIMNIKKAFIAF